MEEELLKLIKLNDENKVIKYINDNFESIDWKKIIIDETKPVNSIGHYILGYKYRRGLGVESNDKKAFYYCELSAKQGNSHAQYGLGCLYESGIGVEKNNRKAFYYYELSAKQKNPYGQNNLGYMYQYGSGVERDEKKALYYFGLSAKQGSIYGRRHFREILKNNKNYLDIIESIYLKNFELEDKIIALEEKMEEIKYIPGYGQIYFEARKHFEDNKN